MSFDKQIFLLEMVKYGICSGGASKQNALFSKKCAPKSASMSSMSRIGPACVFPVTWSFYDFDLQVARQNQN